MKKQIANWGNYPVIESNEESFTFPEQLTGTAFEIRKRFIPRGNGRCYGDASLARPYISTLKFERYFPLIGRTAYLNVRAGLPWIRYWK